MRLGEAQIYKIKDEYSKIIYNKQKIKENNADIYKLTQDSSEVIRRPTTVNIVNIQK